LEELEKVLTDLNDGKIKPIISQWTKRSSTIGRSVITSTQDGKILGKAIKVDSDGSLIVKHGSKQFKVTAGDVIYQK
jgi:BirA family biotin operon repressor/biotin-[acetyl-CoA-carboxylase] ligase